MRMSQNKVILRKKGQFPYKYYTEEGETDDAFEAHDFEGLSNVKEFLKKNYEGKLHSEIWEVFDVILYATLRKIPQEELNE